MAGTLEARTIAQIGIIVRDIEATAKAWAELFGLPMPEITITATYDVTHAQYKGAPTMARVKQAFFKFSNIDIELLEPVGEPSTWQDQLEEHGNSLHHLAVRAGTIDQMMEKLPALEAQGLSLIQRGDWVPNGRYLYLDSAEKLGTILEILPGQP